MQQILKRQSGFYANSSHKPFDENLALVQDFVPKSDFRKFYQAHRSFYQSITSRYADYYLLDTIQSFLERQVGAVKRVSGNSCYRIVLSPLVGRMNCHRRLDSYTVADFPNVSTALIQSDSVPVDRVGQAVDIHTLFTEMDHGYINPITDLFAREIAQQFRSASWEERSGYKGTDCWNEYVTWGLYDSFLQTYFPQIADSVATQWHYQNGSRGFYASSLFAGRLMQLYRQKKPGQ